MTSEQIMERMAELMRPIDMQIMMCDTTDEVLMLASAMLTTAKDIYVQQLGEKNAVDLINMMLDNIVKDKNV
jgi:hypothetical protein